MKCKHCKKTFKITYDEKTFPTNINSFNWGAFGLWPLWGFGNGKPWLFGISILCNIPFIGWISGILISIYLGLNGNRLSWEKKNWYSIEYFEKYQSRWNAAGAICCVISVALIIFTFTKI